MSDALDWGRRQQAAREKWISISFYEVKIRRPDHIELRRYERAGDDLDEAVVLRHVLDWRGITEAHLAPGVGGEDLVPFTTFAWREWVGSRPDDFKAVAEAIVEEFKAHNARREAVEGKSAST